jgi:hypothetical protein
LPITVPVIVTYRSQIFSVGLPFCVSLNKWTTNLLRSGVHIIGLTVPGWGYCYCQYLVLLLAVMVIRLIHCPVLLLLLLWQKIIYTTNSRVGYYPHLLRKMLLLKQGTWKPYYLYVSFLSIYCMDIICMFSKRKNRILRRPQFIKLEQINLWNNIRRCKRC